MRQRESERKRQRETERERYGERKRERQREIYKDLEIYTYIYFLKIRKDNVKAEQEEEKCDEKAI